jgi:hypothetical protein
MSEKKTVIKANEVGADLIKQLCDVALKAGGVQNLQGVITVMSKLELIEKSVPTVNSIVTQATKEPLETPDKKEQ